jgi:hypothetical protein
MTLKLRLKILCGRVRALHRKRPPNLWEFSRAVHEVMARRMALSFTGKLSATEARRMVMEKQLAVVLAQLAYTESILNGARESALVAYFNVYWRAVESNRKRLSDRRWRWLRLR